jgi:branched-chain amino acid transport system substrate-binding protein
VGTSFNAADRKAAVQRFVRAFERKYRIKPDAFAALAYDATRLLAEAIARKGNDRGAIREYLASLGSASAFDGVSGPVYFNKSGDPIGMGFHVAQVIGGSLVSGGSGIAVPAPVEVAAVEHP